jgi:hypothetical protein
MLLCCLGPSTPVEARRKARPRPTTVRPDTDAPRPTATGRPTLRRVTPLSFRVISLIELWSQPGKEGRLVGAAAPGTILPILRKTQGRRCQDGVWFEVATNAWLCASAGKPTWRFPKTAPQPILPDGALVPRKAFYARRDGVPLYLKKEDVLAKKHDRLVEKGFSLSIAAYGVRIGGETFMRSRNGELVPASDMYAYTPSAFAGKVLFKPPEQPLGCVVGYRSSDVRDRPNGNRVGRIEFHSWVEIFEERRVGTDRWYRIGPDRWVKAANLRKIHVTEPPKEAKPDEPWIEVLLNHQTLVAYEGKRPVFATLVSTGRFEHKTPQGIFRIKTKVAMSAMNNRPGDEELYRVDDVPWIQYFLEGYALHGTYWHDQFGNPKSHGCINLSPKDARWLFEWSPPRLPTGWNAIESSPDGPGVLLRVRNAPSSQVSTQVTRPNAPEAPSRTTGE